MSTRAATRVLILILLSSALGCASDYNNRRLNDPALPLAQRKFNTNPQTESCIDEIEMNAPDSTRPSTQPAINTRENSMPATQTAEQLDALVPGRVRAKGVADRDGYFVGLAISGGGSRSSVFAAACMFELQRLGLLEKVDAISAVSGGTLPASLYCVDSDPEWTWANVRPKLAHSFATDTIRDLLNPYNLFGLLFSNLTRADLLAGHLEDILYTRDGHPLTFADLRLDGRPRLFINATSLETGRRFVFDNETFDLINSDLNSYPISRAVTASSAAPIILHPIPLCDFSTISPHYYHLLDGGLCDNLGVQTLVDSFEAQSRRSPNPYPHGMILIVIDAGQSFNSQLGTKPVLSALDVLMLELNLSTVTLLGRASTATMNDIVMSHSLGTYSAQELRTLTDQLQRDHDIEIRDLQNLPVHVIHISLAQVADVSDIAFGNSINGISTSFDIQPQQADDLSKAAQLLFARRFDAKLEPIVRELDAAAAR